MVFSFCARISYKNSTCNYKFSGKGKTLQNILKAHLHPKYLMHCKHDAPNLSSLRCFPILSFLCQINLIGWNLEWHLKMLHRGGTPIFFYRKPYTCLILIVKTNDMPWISNGTKGLLKSSNHSLWITSSSNMVLQSMTQNDQEILSENETSILWLNKNSSKAFSTNKCLV